jgi:hypothetical protein
MMACAGSVRYQVKFNSEETEVFVPTRCLRQGDPSPHICSSYVQRGSSLLQYEEEVGGIDGLRVCKKCTFSFTPFI